MAGIKGKALSVAGLAAAGVRRISLASSLYRAADQMPASAMQNVTR